jgi:hypothetical protein
MIEKKYEKFNNFSEKNSFVQFDQQEQQAIIGGKNWYLYDYSEIAFNFANQAYYPQPTSTYNTPPVIQDLWLRGEGIVSFTGAFGSVQVNKSDKLEFVENTEIPEAAPSLLVNENLYGYLDSNRGSAYGGSIRTATNIKSFRSGYFEITFRSDKENCIIACGTNEAVVGKSIGDTSDSTINGYDIPYNSQLSTSIGVESQPASAEDFPKYEVNSPDSGLTTLEVGIKDGKIVVKYDDFLNKDLSYEFVGNKIVSDDKWHHVVVNFGRPGLIKEHGKKINKKFVDIWIDGQLDKRFSDKVNENHYFYPTLLHTFANPISLYSGYLQEREIFSSFDGQLYSDGFTLGQTAGYAELLRAIVTLDIGPGTGNDSVTNFISSAMEFESVRKHMFKGVVETMAAGILMPLSMYEIQNRNALFRRQEKRFHRTMTCKAEILDPKINTNSKKALKLFWNTLVSDGKFGLSLDDTFEVDTYSVTHRTKNSPSEIFNLNKTKLNGLTISEDVRAAFKDNVLIKGPGRVSLGNTISSLYSNVVGEGAGAFQRDPRNSAARDGVYGLSSSNKYDQQGGTRYVGPLTNLTFSGLTLNPGDRILLTNQILKEENGVWIFNGLDEYLTRPSDALLPDTSKPELIYVSEGIYSGKYWMQLNPVKSLSEQQHWIEYEYNLGEFPMAKPIFGEAWEDNFGNDRFIDINEDLELDKYDVISFMNYPETNNEIEENFQSDFGISLTEKYKDFVNSLKFAAAIGASIYVSSPKLAEFLGIV